MVKKIGLLAGGSGIAPCLQILKEVHENRPNDQTEISLLFGAPQFEVRYLSQFFFCCFEICFTEKTMTMTGTCLQK